MGASGGKWVKALIGLKKPERDDQVSYTFLHPLQVSSNIFMYLVSGALFCTYRRRWGARARNGGCGGALQGKWGLHGGVSKVLTIKQQQYQKGQIHQELMHSQLQWPLWFGLLLRISELLGKNGQLFASKLLFVASW